MFKIKKKMMNFECVWILRIFVLCVFFATVSCQKTSLLNNKELRNGQLNSEELSHLRLVRNVFMGMRGKKMKDQELDMQKDQSTPLMEVKRLDGFMAMRGRKMDPFQTSFEEENDISKEQSLFPEDKRSKGFLGMRGKKQPTGGEMNRWSNSKFFAMRGKREK